MKIEVGSFFKLKEGAREDLTPAFDKIIKAFVKGVIEERLANPEYFFEITYLERGGPLENFLKRVFEGLKRPGPTVLPLRIGFGFGKTHASILLLHSILSAEKIPESAKEVLRSAGWSEELARKTLVFPIDFYAEQRPAASLRRILKAYTDRGTGFWRGENIKKRIEEEGFDDEEAPADFAKKLISLARKSGTSLLFIIDEIGWGSRKLIEEYIHGKGGDASLWQLTWLTSFLTNLAEESNRERVPFALIYSFAEQDERAIEYLAATDERVKRLWEVAKSDLFNKLARYTGGIEETALGLNPDDMIKIAMFRVLSPIEKEPDRDEISLKLAGSASAFLGIRNIEDVRELLRRYYPLSPLMVHALRKLARRNDLPATEYVRSAISMLAGAAERALNNDPYSPTIDVKHLELEAACFPGNLGDATADWLGLVAELKVSISSAEKELIESCEHAAKVILSKGATSNTITLLKIKDREAAEIYGTTLEELQLAAFLTSRPEEAEKAVSSMKKAIDYLLRTSSSIEERTIEGVSFLFPAIAGTILSKLKDYISEERRKASQDPLGYLRSSSFLYLVTSHLRSEKASVFFADYSHVEDPEKLASLVGKTLNEPKPAIVFVNLHDEKLAQKIREIGWNAVVSNIVTKLNEDASVKAIGRPPYLILLIPNLGEERLKPLLESLTEYQGAESFLEYLRDEERVIEDFMSRAEAIVTVKRLGMPAKELRKIIQGKVGNEIGAARDLADRSKLRAAREAAKRLVDLYSEAVIIYDLDSRRFSPISISELITKAMEGVEMKDPKMCADVLNTLLSNIIEARFVSSTNRLEKPVKEFIKRRIEEGQMGEVRIDDIFESLFQGSFGVVPVSRAIAENTISMLNGATFDLPDKTVTTFAKEGRISFEVKVKPKIIEKERELAPAEVEVETLREFMLSGIPKENIMELREVLNSLKGDVISLVVNLKEEDGYNLGALTIRRNFSDAIGPLAALARTLDAKGEFRVMLRAPKSKDEIAKILGPLSKYLRLEGTSYA